MGRKKWDIASAGEVLAYLTGVMRDEAAKERFRAAEMLGKHFGLFRDGAPEAGETVVLVNDIFSASE